MHTPLRALPTALLLCAFAIASFSPGSPPAGATGQEETPEQVLWAAYWTVQPGFTSTLEMKNNRAEETLTVHISLYFESGEEFYLDPIELEPRQAAAIHLNRVLETLPESLAARASREGSLEVKFRASTPKALMGSVSVTNPERGIAWNFFMYPVFAAGPLVPVRGVFWFHDEGTDGFVVLHNASEEPMKVSPRLQISGRSYAVSPFWLRSGQFHKFPFRRALRSIGLRDVTAGGIEFSYEGVPDALKAHGVLFNNHGFSAEIDFLRADVWQQERAVGLRTPRFATGRADPVLGLPQGTKFRPLLALHNFWPNPTDISLAVGYRTGEGQQELTIPVRIAPTDTQVIALHPYLENTIPPETPWASLEVRYTGPEFGVVAAMVSVSENGEHSIRSVLNWVEGNIREGWHWRVDSDHNTLLGIYNADSEESRVLVSLDYHADGIKHSYELPELTLPGHGSQLVDVGQVISDGQPDSDGEVIPVGVTLGGYRLRKVAGNPTASVITEALVINRRTKSFLTFYNTAICVQSIEFDPPSGVPIEGFVGDVRNIYIFGVDENGFPWDFTAQGEYFSGAENVAAITGPGFVSLVAPGETTVLTSIQYYGPEQDCFLCSPEPTCVPRTGNSFNPVRVNPRLGGFRITVVSTPIPGETNSLVSGQSGQVKVQALDDTGAVFTGYRGTVRFSSSDAMATLPGDYTYTSTDAGVHTFDVTLKTVAGTSPTRDLAVTDLATAISTGKNIFVWFRVFATREGLVGQTTSCGHMIIPNDHFVALPAAGLCNVGVRLANGSIKRDEVKLDTGPWCPHSQAATGNPCVCPSDPYWNTTGVPAVESLSCDPNNAGIDLADGSFADLGLSNNGFIHWRFR